MVVLLIKKNGGIKEVMWVEETGHCPKCKVELTNVDLKLHSCPRCNGPIYKQNILWKKRVD
jgi:Zn finger protein HypA/HybF involved in hydrogenase expression